MVLLGVLYGVVAEYIGDFGRGGIDEGGMDEVDS
jgi:hypothetical protein